MRTRSCLSFCAMCVALLLSVMHSAFAAEGPFGGTPAAIPGKVMAENYDTGGQGVGYNVTSVNGTANGYRSDGVDLQAASAPATGNNLGWAAAGQWFRYTVNVSTAGTYKVSFLVAAASTIGDAFHLSNSSGTNLSGSVMVPNTGAFQTWATVTATVTLPAGVQTLTLNEDAAHWNIDSMVFALVSGGEGPFGGTPAAIPGKVMAENYDTGGQGVGYNVTSVNGTANAYRSDGVDLQAASAPATGNNLGWAAAGQWFRYTVNVSTAGTYTVSFLVAATSAIGDAFHLSNSSGTDLSGSVMVPNTGAFQTWATVTASVTLPAGVQTLTLDEDAAHWNIDSFTFTGGTSPVPPQPPTGLTAKAVSSSEIDLSWAASTTNGVTYNVLQNGTQIANVTGTTYANTGLTASTTYSYTVEATDSGGTSTADGPVSATTLSGGGGTGNCAGVSDIVVNGTTYKPTWCQEFNGPVGSAIDTTVWNFDLGGGGWGNGEAEIYCGPPGHPGNPAQCPTTFSTATAPIYIDGNGHLVIRPINENGAWLSGRINTQGKQNFSFGILEASVELPNTTNQGLWPAFWTLGANIGSVGWPTCGEEDILEDWSPQVHNGAGTTGDISTAHTKDTGGSGVGGRYTFPSGEAGNTAFHTYGIVWTTNDVSTFVDDPSKTFVSITPSRLPAGDTWPFNQDLFTILNVAVGGTLGGSTAGLASPAQPMLVDYVRWYTAQ
jgi:beta-glucanase (GH16 family)